MNYELAYRIGFHPWGDAEESPVHREDHGIVRTGRERARIALRAGADLGTGSGIGGSCWRSVVGRSRVSTWSKRLCSARDQRVKDAGVDIQLVRGRTRFRGGTNSDFRLVLDTGTFPA